MAIMGVFCTVYSRWFLNCSRLIELECTRLLSWKAFLDSIAESNFIVLGVPQFVTSVSIWHLHVRSWYTYYRWNIRWSFFGEKKCVRLNLCQTILHVFWNEFYTIFCIRIFPYLYHDLPGRNCIISRLSSELWQCLYSVSRCVHSCVIFFIIDIDVQILALRFHAFFCNGNILVAV